MQVEQVKHCNILDNFEIFLVFRLYSRIESIVLIIIQVENS